MNHEFKRSQRQVNLATQILESAGYQVTKLNESWPPILNNLQRYEKDRVRSALNANGYDIENLPSEDIQLTSGRDTRIKKGMTIAVFGKTKIAVWVNGQSIVDTYPVTYEESTADMSWKKILSLNPKTYYMAFDQDKFNALRQKRSDRKESQDGMVRRYTSKDFPRRGYMRHLDKSGYIVDPDKYENMLAAMNIANGSQILQDARDIYVKLANMIDKVDIDKNSRIRDDYRRLMVVILDNFMDLSRSLKSYEKIKQKYGEDDYFTASEKFSVTNAIKSLKQCMRDAKKFDSLGERE